MAPVTDESINSIDKRMAKRERKTAKRQRRHKRINAVLPFIWVTYFGLASGMWIGFLTRDVLRHKGWGEYIPDILFIVLFSALNLMIFALERRSAVLDNDLEWLERDLERMQSLHRMLDTIADDTDKAIAKAERLAFRRGAASVTSKAKAAKKGTK